MRGRRGCKTGRGTCPLDPELDDAGMKLGHIELFVADPARSGDFYERVLGFEVVSVQPRVIWLKCGEVELLLRPGTRRLDAPAYNRSEVGIVLYTDDLEKTMTGLKSRGLQFRGTDGSESCPTFTDPDGHWFQLVDPKQQE
jgi:catechol 2,3-dioxygenase-like lactoylglutathione lyase family enzyme